MRRLLPVLLAFASASVSGQVLQPYVTTTEGLTLPAGYPLGVAVGRGYKVAPVRAELRCLTPDTRGDWYDNHQDAACVQVAVIAETTRVEAALIKPRVTDRRTLGDLLTNGGFEEGLVGWTVSYTEPGAVAASTAEHFHGSGSAQVVVYNMEFSAASISQSKGTLAIGQRYCLRATVKQDDANGGGFAISVTNPAKVVDLLLYKDTGGDWMSQRSCFVALSKSATVTITASPGIQTGGGYVDAVSLEAVDE